jgi:Fur family ferric uptake transcriptional regulator
MKPAQNDPAIAKTIRNIGARATVARTRVFALIKEAAFPLCHTEIATRLAQKSLPVDRVTIYRVLDWLVHAGLAHKVADGHGIFRFSAINTQGQHTQHLHLRCTGCGGVFCLNTPPPALPALPRGFRFASMSLDLRGECPRCVESHA